MYVTFPEQDAFLLVTQSTSSGGYRPFRLLEYYCLTNQVLKHTNVTCLPFLVNQDLKEIEQGINARITELKRVVYRSFPDKREIGYNKTCDII